MSAESCPRRREIQNRVDIILKSVRLFVFLVAVGGFIGGCSHLPLSTHPQGKTSLNKAASKGNIQKPAAEQNASDEKDAQDLTSSGDASDAEDAAQIDDTGEPVIADGDEADGEAADAGADAPESEIATESDPSAKEGQSSLDEALDFCEVSQDFWQKGELDKALEALDKAYSLIVEVDTQQNAKLMQQKEDLRYLISKRILEIYASRNIVVNGNHGEIPMEMNRHVQAEINRFTNGEKEFFIESYQRSGKYRPYIVQALKKEGLPEELSWLPLIESGFKIKALSRARALGLWQFIPSTGYKFGLKRTRYIDERIDFIKATNAAIAYLKELHNIFGDWATVLAAYNCGEGRVLQVIRTQNVNYLDNFWDLYERLPMETARYVPRFFATLQMVKNPKQYGLDQVVLEKPPAFDSVEVNRQVKLADLSQASGISLDSLKALNPELRYNLLPPETYDLRIPPGEKEDLLAKLDSIPTSHLPQRAYVWHRVRLGETLSTIARRFHTSVHRIMRANHLRRSHFIRAGNRLKIPRRGYIIAQSRSVKPAAIPHSGIHYVRKGDSLWIIAKRYSTTVKKIEEVNNLANSHLYIGQALKIPGYNPEPLPDTSQLNTYSVKAGDSPFTIAQQHNMQLERLLRINSLTTRSKIFPGQRLFIE